MSFGLSLNHEASNKNCECIVQFSVAPFIAGLHEIESWGWDANKLVDCLIGLDYQLFSGLTQELEGTTEQWVPVIKEHPDVWRVVCAEPEVIVGYWDFIPLNDECYEIARNGEWIDSKIDVSMLTKLDKPGHYKAYLVSIGLLPQYRVAECRKLLYGSFLDNLRDLSKRGVIFDEFCASAWSPAGAAICERWGLKKISQHSIRGDMYAGQIRIL